MIVALLGALALVAIAVFVPHPGPTQIRDWARSVGPMFPLLFFVVHAVVTVSPFPRTAFTISAGMLFGSVLGIAIAVSATAVSAVLALVLVRAIGRDAVAARLTHPAVQAVDRRLARRGWLAVGSSRLIAPIPFSVINYCCGVSSVRLVPYLIATVLGVIPGTIGVVVLGDALTEHTNPWLLAFSAVCVAIGLLGLVIDARLDTPRPGGPAHAGTRRFLGRRAERSPGPARTR